MNRNSKKLDNVGKWISQLPKYQPDKDFEKKFWERFEAQKIQAPPKAAPKILAPTLCGIAAAFVSVSVFIGLLPEKPITELIYGNPTVNTSSLKQGIALKSQDTVKTPANDWVILRFKDNYFIKLLPNSEVSIKNLRKHFGLFGQKTVLELKKGEILVSIDKARRYPVEIRTLNAFAMAKGTQFIVQAPSAARPYSWIGVLNGQVLVGSSMPKALTNPSVLLEKNRTASVDSQSGRLTSEELLYPARIELQEMFQFSRKSQVLLLISPTAGRVHELLKPAPIYIRLENKNTSLRALDSSLKSLSMAVKSKNHQVRVLWAQEFEKALSPDLDIDLVSLKLFLGAYYASIQEIDKAISIFENLPNEHPSRLYDSLSLLAASKLYAKRNDHEKSLVLARIILDKYPSSPEASEAAKMLQLTNR